MTFTAENIRTVYGFMDDAEIALLYKLATEVPAGGVIVEIGSFQGKSTIALATGAKEAGALVWAIDPHEDIQVTEQTHYGMENHAALLQNLTTYHLGDVVRVVALSSWAVARAWEDNPIDLLWIDGDHRYEAVKDDFMFWSQRVTTHGKIAMHDTTGHWPGVTRLLEEIKTWKEWDISDPVNATSVLTRVKGVRI